MTDRYRGQQKTRVQRGPFLGHTGPGRHMPILSEKPKDITKTLKKLFTYLGKYRLSLVLTFVCVIGSSILSLLGPYLIGKGIDDYIVPRVLSGFGKFLLFMFFIYVVNSILVYIQGITMAEISQRVGFDLREDAFNSIHKLPLKNIDNRSIGDMMSRITNDIDMINTSITTATVQFLSGIIMIVGTVVMMFILSRSRSYQFDIIPLMVIATNWSIQKHANTFSLNKQNLGDDGMVERILPAKDNKNFRGGKGKRLAG